MRKIVFLFAFVLMASSLFAQEKEGYSTKEGRNSTFVKNGFWDNWFIGAGVGANIYFGDGDNDAPFFKRFTVAPNIQFGKWINPYFGARMKVSGLSSLHTFCNCPSQMSSMKYFSAEANFMWNMSDYLLNYNSKRVYSFIPYVGFGWAYAWDYKSLPPGQKADNMNSMTLDAGIINRFQFSERVALDIEFSGKMLEEKFDANRPGGRGYDILGTAAATLIFKIGSKATFAEAVLRDQNEINMLNNKINAQRAEIEELSQRPNVKPEPEIVIKEVIKQVDNCQEPVNNVVLFSISTTKVEPHQEVNVYNVAKFLKQNPDRKVRIVGYTDKATGTPAVNERLSRERAQNVANIIINKYNIDRNRVIIDWEGQSNPPFNVAEWDRAVILYLE